MENLTNNCKHHTDCFCSEAENPKIKLLSWNDIFDQNEQQWQSNLMGGAAHVDSTETDIDEINDYLLYCHKIKING